MRKRIQKRLEGFGVRGITGHINEDAARHILQRGKVAETKSLGVRLRGQILRRKEQAKKEENESLDEYSRFREVYLHSAPEERNKFTEIYGFDPDERWEKEAAELDKKRHKKQ